MNARPRLHFVTGKLAESVVRGVVGKLANQVGFDWTLDVLGITVAALMTTDWVAKRVRPPDGTDRVILPGFCRGEVSVVEEATGVPTEKGPKDVRELPEFFGRRASRPDDYGPYDLEIVAEINHAPRLAFDELIAQAERLRADGADVIDVGCDPGETWRGVGEAVAALKAHGHRVSVDTYNVAEIASAAAAGAELVLSVNRHNRHAAPDWGVEVVAVPDEPGSLVGLDETVSFLTSKNVRFRLDPILEPLGFGFTKSLERYIETRRRYPDAEILMGVGNLTELTDVDSAGVNVLLLGICQELGIRSVLTTQVINWARSSVRECDLARRLMWYAVNKQTLPKKLEPRLVALRDPKLYELGEEQLATLAEQIKDRNYRLFAERERLHAISAGLHLSGDDPFELFAELARRDPKIDPSHAFYLGYEMAKAVTALTLGKNYRQDQALEWGHLTRPEESHREKQKKAKSGAGDVADESPAAD